MEGQGVSLLAHRPPSRNNPNPSNPPSHKPKPHNRLDHRTLHYLDLAPNSFSMSWPVFRPAPCQPPCMSNQLHPTLSPPTPPTPPPHRPPAPCRPTHPLPPSPRPPRLPPRYPRLARLLPPRYSPKPNHLPHRPLALSKVEGSTHASQTGTPPGSTLAPPATSPQTANSFRINTYTPSRKC